MILRSTNGWPGCVPTLRCGLHGDGFVTAVPAPALRGLRTACTAWLGQRRNGGLPEGAGRLRSRAAQTEPEWNYQPGSGRLPSGRRLAPVVAAWVHAAIAMGVMRWGVGRSR